MTRHMLVPSLAAKEPLRTVPRRQGAVGPKPLHAMVAAKMKIIYSQTGFLDLE